jgi:hypothetical protein
MTKYVGPTPPAARADVSASVRRTAANEAAPTSTNWPARPAGYVYVEAIGLDPDPVWMQAGDTRSVPVTS